MKKSERFTVDGTPTDTEVTVIVNGVTYLRFIETETRGPWCVAKYRHSRTPPKVSRADFIAARNFAKEQMRRAKNADPKKADGRITDEQIARNILGIARNQKRNPMEVLDDYAKHVSWFSRDRLGDVRSAIGKIGGEASSRRAKRNKARAAREAEAKRQFRLAI